MIKEKKENALLLSTQMQMKLDDVAQRKSVKVGPQNGAQPFQQHSAQPFKRTVHERNYALLRKAHIFVENYIKPGFNFNFKCNIEITHK